MSKWKTVRLGDVCEIQSGGTPSRSKQEYWKNGNIPWIKIGDFSGKYLSQSSEFITEEGLNNSSAKLFSKGTILYSIFATLGEVSILNIDATTNQAIAGIKLRNESEINIDFFYLYLKSLKDEVNRIGRGVAQNNINLSILKNFIIPLPPLETQKQIAAVLDKCTSLISKYKQILKKYDTLIKSRFIEMFGDPTTNPMNWDTVNISSLLTANASNGFFAKRDEYTEDGNVEVLGVVNIVNTMYSRIDLLPKTNASEKDIKKYSVKYGDMLFCRSSLVAEGIGKASIVPENINKTILFECHVIRLRLDLNKCVPEYMQMLSTTSFFRNQVLKHAKTSTMTTIGQDGILKTDVRLPPIEKQKQFLSFIKQIDKSKFVVQKSLEKAETLYKSLMQEYFG